jgi:hypothetical protein
MKIEDNNIILSVKTCCARFKVLPAVTMKNTVF